MGSRTKVSGKPVIKIDGVVTGIVDGKTVIPHFRFPGEATFAEGTPVPHLGWLVHLAAQHGHKVLCLRHTR